MKGRGICVDGGENIKQEERTNVVWVWGGGGRGGNGFW